MNMSVHVLVTGFMLSGLSPPVRAQSLLTEDPTEATLRASIDVSRPGGRYRPVSDMITPWNSKGNRLPFEDGSTYHRRFREAGFSLCRLVAFSDTWLWGTEITRGVDGRIVLDFTDFDAMLDLAVSAQCEPYIRLAYNVPAVLSSAPPKALPNRVAYSRPRDLQEWDQLMGDIVRHCNVTRKLGIRYFVASLNEADLAVRKGDCSWDMVLDLYARTVRTVKGIDPSIKVGGPAIANDPRYVGEPFMRDFLRYCTENNLPLDFVCYHGYKKRHPSVLEDMLLAVKRMVKEECPDLSPEPEYFCDEFGLWLKTAKDDNEYGAAYLTASHHFMRRGGITKISNVSFNHFHKYDENFVYNDRTIKRYIGLPLLKGPVVTAPYFALKMQAELRGQALPVRLNGSGGITDDHTAGILATVDGRRFAMLAWSFDPASTSGRSFEVDVTGLESGEKRRLTQYLLDHDHSNPYTDYVLKKKDTNGGRYNLEDGDMDLVREDDMVADGTGQATLEFQLEPLAVTLLILE